MKICILGLGYIGFPTACLFATHGNSVMGVDVNQEIVDKLNNKQLHIEEKGLKEIFDQAMNSGNLVIQNQVSEADAFIIAVPTPLDSDNCSKLDYVKSAAEMITKVIKKGDLVVLESTVPPLTTVKLIKPTIEKTGMKLNEDFYLAHCPERAIPGDTLHEMINNSRVIGGSCERANEFAKKVYSSFVKGEIFLTDSTTSETVKLVENASRDASIAFANELAIIADELEINVWELIELANKHPRINILKPGPGVGGHCIAIDPWFLTESITKSELIPLVRRINDSMPKYVLKLIKRKVKNIENPTVTVLGVAYKENIGDTRESPAIKLIKLLERENYNVKIHDPFVNDFSHDLLSFEQAVKDSDCLVIITAHSSFKEINPESIGEMRTKNIVDSRNCINEKKFKNAGFSVKILGKGN